MKKHKLILISIILCLILFSSSSHTIFAETQSKVFKGYFNNVDYSDVSVFLNSGSQTKITKEIEDIAKQFNDKKDISTIKEIYNWLINNLKYGDGEKFGRTSIEIINSKKYTGCTDMGLAFIALTRAKGIPSVFVQTGRIDWIEKRVANNPASGSIVGHILVEVYLDDKWYLVDSTSGKLYLDYDKNNFSLPDGYYVFAKSIEVWDTGILNERMNHDKMMDLFKDFDVKKYKNPLYDYIDLRTGEKLKSKEFTSSSEENGFKALILGDRDPVEIFDSIFTRSIKNKDLCSYNLASKNSLFNSENIIYLYYPQFTTPIPDYFIELMPEIKDNKTNIVISRSDNKRRIVIIKCKTKDILLNAIKNLPSDILNKDYNINVDNTKTNNNSANYKPVIYYLKVNSYLTKIPTTDFKNKKNIITAIPKNAKVTLISNSNKSYYKVNYNNKIGYVMSKNLSSTLITESVPNKSSAPKSNLNLKWDESIIKHAPSSLDDKDTDGDGLYDYEEKYKYFTDPNNPDSDNDGIFDGDWNERREYTYSIIDRLILTKESINQLEDLSDDYQDAKIIGETDGKYEVEMILYPYNKINELVNMNYKKWRDYKNNPKLLEFIKPGLVSNYDNELINFIKKDLKEKRIVDVDNPNVSDYEIVNKVSRYMVSPEFKLTSENLGPFDLFIDFNEDGTVSVDKDIKDAVDLESVFNDSIKLNNLKTKEEMYDHILFGKGMYLNKSHGNCTSTAYLMNTVFKALGIPSRVIITIPSIDYNLVEQIDKLYENVKNSEVISTIEEAYAEGYYGHYFNEVYIGGRWIRVNYDRIAQNILDSNYGGLMIKTGTETDHFTHEGFQKRYGLSRDNLKKEKNLYISESAAAYYSKNIKEENGKYSKIKVETTSNNKLLSFKPMILGEKDPVELFDSIFAKNIITKKLSSFSSISKSELYTSNNIILLKSDDKNNYIPDYVSELAPEINDNTTNIVISKIKNKRRIIIIKCKTEDLLLKTIKNLPDDILTKDYSINLGS